MRALRLGETWIMNEEYAYGTYTGAHSRSARKARARCEDGKLRVITIGVPDTYFSIPGHTRVKGKYVSGFVSVDSESEEFKFIQYARYD